MHVPLFRCDRRPRSWPTEQWSIYRETIARHYEATSGCKADVVLVRATLLIGNLRFHCNRHLATLQHNTRRRGFPVVYISRHCDWEGKCLSSTWPTKTMTCITSSYWSSMVAKTNQFPFSLSLCLFINVSDPVSRVFQYSMTVSRRREYFSIRRQSRSGRLYTVSDLWSAGCNNDQIS